MTLNEGMYKKMGKQRDRYVCFWGKDTHTHTQTEHNKKRGPKREKHLQHLIFFLSVTIAYKTSGQDHTLINM